MARTSSAHLDTFCRDRLPPPELWPQLRFDLAELRYPERLNAAAELLAGPAGHRPCVRGSGIDWSYRELREHAHRVAAVLVQDHGLVPGNRVLLRGPNEPWLVACWLGVLLAGGVAVATMPMLRRSELEAITELARPSLALCHHAWTDEPSGAAHHRLCRPGRADRPVRRARSVAAGRAHRGRRRGPARLHLGHHRPAEGHHAPAPRSAGHRRHVRPACGPDRPGRPGHRHPADRVHLRAGRPGGVPAAGGGQHPAGGPGDPGGAGRRGGRAPRHRAVHRAHRLPGDHGCRSGRPVGRRTPGGFGR